MTFWHPKIFCHTERIGSYLNTSIICWKLILNDGERWQQRWPTLSVERYQTDAALTDTMATAVPLSYHLAFHIKTIILILFWITGWVFQIHWRHTNNHRTYSSHPIIRLRRRAARTITECALLLSRRKRWGDTHPRGVGRSCMLHAVLLNFWVHTVWRVSIPSLPHFLV